MMKKDKLSKGFHPLDLLFEITSLDLIYFMTFVRQETGDENILYNTKDSRIVFLADKIQV
jgi:hypothetical protein